MSADDDVVLLSDNERTFHVLAVVGRILFKQQHGQNTRESRLNTPTVTSINMLIFQRGRRASLFPFALVCLRISKR